MAAHIVPPRRQRLTVLATVAGLHLLALLALFLGRGEMLPTPVKAGALSVVSLGADSRERPVPKPKLPSKLVDRTVPPEAIVMSSQIDQGASGASAAGCATLELITKAVAADPAAVDAVYHAPPETRSIAGAVVMWNAGWSTSALTIDAPLGRVRAIAEQSLASLDDNCLEEEIIGPRLIPVAIGDGTMFIVFGSGLWRWRELLFRADERAAFHNEPAPRPFWKF